MKVPTRNAEAVIAAETLYQTFYEYKQAGFTYEEALELVIAIIQATIAAQYLNRK